MVAVELVFVTVSRECVGLAGVASMSVVMRLVVVVVVVDGGVGI